MSDVAKRVAAGTAFLDEHDPGWWSTDADPAISLEMLEMPLGDRCILGQRCPVTVLARYDALRHDAADRHAPYFAYAEHLMRVAGLDGGLSPWDAEHGFTAGGLGGPGYAREWGALTAEWRRVIEERRSAS